MNYCELKKNDIANGEGVRTSLFVSGCTNHCEECFQPQTWDFDFGIPFTEATEKEILESLEPYYINGLTLLGGEPFEPENQRALLPFVKQVKDIYPNKSIWAFSGFTIEQLLSDTPHPRCEVTDEFLGLIDILVDGKFELERKNIRLRFRGSENQRILNLPETLKHNTPVLWEG